MDKVRYELYIKFTLYFTDAIENEVHPTALNLVYTLNINMQYKSLELCLKLTTPIAGSLGRVVSNSASYPGGPEFKSRLRDRLTALRLRGFYPSRQANTDPVRSIRPRHLASTAFQIHYLLTSKLPVENDGKI
jgi:hypothetical protein